MNNAEAYDVIRATLREIAPEVDLSSIDPVEDLREAAGLDSMDFLNFVTRLAESTGLELPERDYVRLSTIGEAITYLAEKVPSSR